MVRASTLSVVILLASCASAFNAKTAMINPGDTREQVLAIMGPSGDRQFSGDQEAWQYCKMGVSIGVNAFKVIWMQKGRVVAITSHTNGGPGCSVGFQRIDWSQHPPDQIIEIRNR